MPKKTYSSPIEDVWELTTEETLTIFKNALGIVDGKLYDLRWGMRGNVEFTHSHPERTVVETDTPGKHRQWKNPLPLKSERGVKDG